MRSDYSFPVQYWNVRNSHNSTHRPALVRALGRLPSIKNLILRQCYGFRALIQPQERYHSVVSSLGDEIGALMEQSLR